MVKKVFGLILLLIFFFSYSSAEDIVVPEGILDNIDIGQAQELITELGGLSEQIEGMKGYVEDRTNLLASYVGTQLLQLTSFLIIIIIISNLCTGLLILGIVLYLKSKRRW